MTVTHQVESRLGLGARIVSDSTEDCIHTRGQISHAERDDLNCAPERLSQRAART